MGCTLVSMLTWQAFSYFRKIIFPDYHYRHSSASRRWSLWERRVTMSTSLPCQMHWECQSAWCTLTAAHAIMVVSVWTIMILFLLRVTQQNPYWPCCTGLATMTFSIPSDSAFQVSDHDPEPGVDRACLHVYLFWVVFHTFLLQAVSISGAHKWDHRQQGLPTKNSRSREILLFH